MQKSTHNYWDAFLLLPLKTLLRRITTPHIYGVYLELIVVNGLIIITARGATRAVKLAGDGVSDVGQLLLLLLEVLRGGSSSVLLKPLGSLLNGINDLMYMLATISRDLLVRIW